MCRNFQDKQFCVQNKGRWAKMEPGFQREIFQHAEGEAKTELT